MKSKRSKKQRKLEKKEKVIIIFLIIATLIRIYIQAKMPLYLQAGAGFDDFLLVSYSKSILKGEWLGQFGTRTLAKGVSYSLFLIIAYLLGIPYSIALICTYIFGIILFVKVIKKYISNKYYLIAIYLLLLYSPVMFHIENVQKIYRGGVIIALTLIVISSMIGIYNSKNEKLKRMMVYSIIAAVSLPFFYYLKEDSIWIMPFVLGTIFLTIIYLMRNKQDRIKTRIFLTILPLLTLLISNYAYCSINYLYYGEFSITDRSGTYFKEMMADIIKIDEQKEKEDVWITKKMMYKAVDASPTLQTIKDEIDNMYENSWALVDGEFKGDMIFWIIKETVGEAGIYDKGGKYVNDFYKKVDKELDDAYAKGSLKIDEDNKIYLSSIAAGFTKKELFDYYWKETPEIIKMLITYSENETTVNNAYGEYPDIVFMDNLTNSVTVWPSEMTDSYAMYNIIVRISNIIVNIYKKTGGILFITSMIGLLIFAVRTVVEAFKKKYDNLDLLLIMLGIMVISAALLFGVEWFTSWFGSSILRHVYNYTGSVIPLIQILEITGLYFLSKEIIEYIKKVRSKV